MFTQEESHSGGTSVEINIFGLTYRFWYWHQYFCTDIDIFVLKSIFLCWYLLYCTGKRFTWGPVSFYGYVEWRDIEFWGTEFQIKSDTKLWCGDNCTKKIKQSNKATRTAERICCNQRMRLCWMTLEHSFILLQNCWHYLHVVIMFFPRKGGNVVYVGYLCIVTW